MINLIDDGTKRELKAARTNVVLATYCVVVAGAVLIVALLAVFSYWWLGNQTRLADESRAANDAKTAVYGDTKRASADFSANLAKIQSVLSNRSHYATALLNIAASLPQGANLTSASLSPSFLTAPVTIIATTPSNDAATALRDQLAKRAIFSNVKLVSVNCGDTGTSCTATISATLAQSVFTPGAAE